MKLDLPLEYIIGISIGTLAILFVIAILIFIYFKNRKIDKKINKIGEEFEIKLTAKLTDWSKGKEVLILVPSLYKYKQSTYFEIDNIVITSNSIIVIEAKSMIGKISGNSDATKWKQVTRSTTRSFYNPISQNDRHIKHLINIFKTKYPYISLIVFSDVATEIEIKNIPNHVMPIKEKHLERALDKIITSTTENQLTKKDRDMVYKKLLSLQTKSKADARFYYKQIKENSK